MSELSQEGLETHIDLAFSIFPEKNIGIIKDQSKSNLVLNSLYWSDQFKIWIGYVRHDLSNNCPDIIRKINSFGIGLQLTDNENIRELNNQWREKSMATDVLSFPVFDESLVSPGNDYTELGDIIVSIPMANKQALEQNHSLAFELRWLVSHGFLHLLGWDHPDSMSLKDMLDFQEQLLRISGNVENAGI